NVGEFEFVPGHHDDGSGEGGQGIELVAQDGGDLGDEDVADDAAADAREDAHHDGAHGADAGVQGLVGADDGEQGEADGVGDLDGVAEAFDLFVAEEGEQAGGHGEGEVAPVGDGDGGDAEDDVAGHAAGGGGGKREDEDAEEVEAVADGEEAAADGEGEGADEVEEGDEGEAHRISRPCGHPGWKPSGFQGSSSTPG